MGKKRQNSAVRRQKVMFGRTLVLYVVHETFIEVTLSQETSPVSKHSWLRTCAVKYNSENEFIDHPKSPNDVSVTSSLEIWTDENWSCKTFNRKLNVSKWNSSKHIMHFVLWAAFRVNFRLQMIWKMTHLNDWDML